MAWVLLKIHDILNAVLTPPLVDSLHNRFVHFEWRRITRLPGCIDSNNAPIYWTRSDEALIGKEHIAGRIKPRKDPPLQVFVVIETNDRPQVIARLVSADESAIVATVAGVETTFRNAEVRSIAADQDSMKIGLFIGAGVGVAGAILGAQGLSCSDCPGQVAAGAALSIGAFTALGALIGKHHHRRVTIYRRR